MKTIINRSKGRVTADFIVKTAIMNLFIFLSLSMILMLIFTWVLGY